MRNNDNNDNNDDQEDSDSKFTEKKSTLTKRRNA